MPMLRHAPVWSCAVFTALLVVATATVGSPIAAATDDATAGPSQLTLFHHSGAQTSSQYWEPELNQPADYTAPTDYSGGTVYVKLVVDNKPSDKPLQALVCFWRHQGAKKFKEETCRGADTLILTTEGTYYATLGSLDSWWKKNGKFDWSKPVSLGRIMLKDPVTGKLMLNKRCGQACYRGNDLVDHVPVRMTARLELVAKGATLTPPTAWRADCPTSWSAKCGGEPSPGAVPKPPPDDTPAPPSPDPSTPPAPVPSSGRNRIYVTNDIKSGPAEYDFALGSAGQQILTGDWNGDGRDGFAVRSGRTVKHYDERGRFIRTVTYGSSSDSVYRVGDWNGDGIDTLAVQRGNVFHLTNSPTAAGAGQKVAYGRRGDEVFVGDWNGDGIDTFAVRRKNVLHVRNSVTSGPADVTFGYGRAGDEILIGDWDQDGTDTFAVRRRNVIFIRNDFLTGVAHTTIGYGKATDTLLVGDWNRDNIDTFAVRRIE